MSEQKLLEERKASFMDKIKFYTESLSKAQKNVSELDSLLQSQRGQLTELKEARNSVEKLRGKVEEQLDIALLILEKARLAVTRFDSDLTCNGKRRGRGNLTF